MRTRCKRFTLMELLIVIGIIAVLAGLLLPALAGAREHAKRTRAQTEMKTLQMAISMYESDYGYLPMGGTERALNSADYTALIQVLQNVPPCGNARGKRYLDISTEQGPGVFNDPWSSAANPQRYQIALDLDYDGDVEKRNSPPPATPPNVAELPYERVYNRVAVWSIGKDRNNDYGHDPDINSWRQ